MLTRRKFLKNASTTIGYGLLGLSPLVTACSLKPYSQTSYLGTVVEPQNLNAVYYWTDVMLQTVRDQSFTPPPATRAFAMGHLAGFAAINGIDHEYEDMFGLPEGGPQDANREVAYGVACSHALADAFQSSFLTNRRHFLDRYPDDGAKAKGIEWGEKVGKAVIKLRTQDGAEISRSAFYLDRYRRRTDSLQWSPTGPFYGAPEGPSFSSFSRGLLPGWGAQQSWVMVDTAAFRAPLFPDARSPEFAEQFVKVKELGGMDSKVRTADQTQIAFFWEDGPRGVTPPGHWQLLAMDLLQHFDFDLYRVAHAFALLSLGQADAGITTWDSKYYHDILRPETAIRQRTSDFDNPDPRVTQDSGWSSLIPTPSFPAYTSGHSTFSGVSAMMLALILGKDDVKFSGASPDLVNWPRQLRDVRRTWPSLSAAADEAGASREYGGIHWHADDVEGLKTGRNLGRYIYKKALRKKV